MPSRNKCKTVLIALLVFGYVIILILYYNDSKDRSETYIEYTREVIHSRNTKYILYWTVFFEYTRILGEGRKAFRQCEYKNCYLTDNRNLLPLENYDAILFHSRDFHWWQSGLPGKRDPSQRYIYVNQENPYHTRTIEPASVKDFYNWTMTYRKDSDIYFPYGMFRKRAQRNPHPFMPTLSLVANKTKMVTWFVSNCNSENNREGVAHELSKYIPIDIYGKCGPLECPPTTGHCYEKLNTEYKFYLSFENAHCVDYITEKVFGIMKRYHVIPIVYGRGDYKTDLPAHSYIDVDDFNTEKDLADYLKYLDRNDTAYLQYFDYRNYYDLDEAMNQRAACDLCKKLFLDQRNSSYADIKHWWHEGLPRTCEPKF